MLFTRAELERIAAGDVDLAFRRWRRPQHRAGGRQRTQLGVVAFDAVEPVDPASISQLDARRAGTDLDTLLGRLATKEGDVYRIRLHHAGADERVALRERAELSPAELAEVRLRLEAMDRRSRSGPWTRQVLELVEARPGELAESLAAQLGRQRQPFKAAVRRLKELGLTESLPVGYRLSPRGAAVLAHLRETGDGRQPLSPGRGRLAP